MTESQQIENFEIARQLQLASETIANSMRLFALVSAMNAENLDRETRGESIAWNYSAYIDAIEECNLTQT